ncbi:Sulfotransferase family protein [Roseovarius azorensis]|uniref:Sulfotransferase family protein n=1 Tax=Roseovarius azorensis TaxID=1287727 RepID=A0A1H7PY96_9RHOB|nr:sulfotransferase [Roseovarius azorensis]SEL40549.1 Sulfotransferase family protein [Roseovarius azorensis]
MVEGGVFGNLFLSIGAMKAGTTWLNAVLRRHPELNCPIEKEIHYFYHRYVDRSTLSDVRRLQNTRNDYILRFDPETANPDMVRRNLQWVCAYLDRPVDDFWYRNLFDMRSHERFACDFSNLNALLPAEAWQQIASRTDDLRVLYTMRDPVKRLWSHMKFDLQFNGKLDLLAGWGAQDYNAYLRQDHIWVNAEYGRVLRNLYAALPESSRKVMFYDDIEADNLGAIRAVESFLGLQPFDYPRWLLERRFTESARVGMPDFFPALVADDVARIKAEIAELGIDPPASWL